MMESWNKGKVLNHVWHFLFCARSELIVIVTPKIKKKESIVFTSVIEIAMLGIYQNYSCEMRTKV